MTKKSKKTDAKPDVKPTKQPITHQYRVLGLQPLSVKMDPQTLGPMEIQKTVCSISIRSVSDNPATQHLTGGSMLAIQFSSTEDDSLVAARQGMSLLEDFLSALALVTGSTFRSTEPCKSPASQRDQKSAISTFSSSFRFPIGACRSLRKKLDPSSTSLLTGMD